MAEASPSSLDLFLKSDMQTAIVDGYWMEIRPVNSIEETAPVDFHIDGTSEDFIDLADTYLKVKVRITTPDGEAGYGNEDAVAPINLLLQSMWSKLDISFNGKRVSSSGHSYPFRAYIESLLNFGNDVKKGQLSASGWHMDTAEHFDTLGAQNQGFTTRKQLGLNRRIISLMGRLHADIFNQNRCLLDGVNMHVQLTRSNDQFCIMRGEHAENFKIKLEEASLFVRKVKVLASCRLGIYKALSSVPARYPIRRTEQRIFSISNNITCWSQENILIGQLPRRLTIGFVRTDSIHGVYNLNPFNFQNFGINFLALYINGKQIPSRALQPEFDGINSDYTRTYMQMSSALGHAFTNQDCGLSYKDFKGGNTLFVFNLNAELTDGEHIETTKRGAVRVECRFAQPLVNPITCLVQSEYDNLILIDKERNISIDYLV